MLSGHSVRMDVPADARRIPTAVPENDWKRLTGWRHTSWLATVKFSVEDRYLQAGTRCATLEVIGSKWSYTVKWCKLNSDDLQDHVAGQHLYIWDAIASGCWLFDVVNALQQRLTRRLETTWMTTLCLMTSKVKKTTLMTWVSLHSFVLIIILWSVSKHSVLFWWESGPTFSKLPKIFSSDFPSFADLRFSKKDSCLNYRWSS